jgi:hypothetical protein
MVNHFALWDRAIFLLKLCTYYRLLLLLFLSSSSSSFCVDFIYFDKLLLLISGKHPPISGHALAQLLEKLRYMPEGRGFDSR